MKDRIKQKLRGVKDFAVDHPDDAILITFAAVCVPVVIIAVKMIIAEDQRLQEVMDIAVAAGKTVVIDGATGELFVANPGDLEPLTS